MSELLEAAMILCFGLSWPISIYRSYVSQTAKGKSLFFEVFLWIGYIFGIVRKFLQFSAGDGGSMLFYLGWFFYVLNLVEISIDMLLYFRNVRLDRERENEVVVEEETVLIEDQE
ncbi:MAG: hypothetical protein LKJ17_01380 [Oscillospiraceae bacterium]|jgi:hypothetical protein|nr:hypothetical protein [Oscillospiraceae bacterium]